MAYLGDIAAVSDGLDEQTNERGISAYCWLFSRSALIEIISILCFLFVRLKIIVCFNKLIHASSDN